MELSEELKTKLDSATSIEEAVEILKENGIEITAAELKAAASEPEGELYEEDLDAVAGGRIIANPVIPLIKMLVKKFAKKSSSGSSGLGHSSGSGRHG